ncbi:MAG: asparagine synthase B [Lachnospiraceae bacterium]|jgi:asparagine synthase (glutamine-hydrolysing)|nr:asparagine synthase B [Lachnospiraceae bacterium]
MCSIIGFERRSIQRNLAEECFAATASRGPDMERFEEAGEGWLGFQRLSIMGLTEKGMQPFVLDRDKVVCNGEIYGFRPLKTEMVIRGYRFSSESDCEIILPMYREFGTEMFSMLDAEFAMIIYDGSTGKLVAARDPIGIRPLYYGQLEDGSTVFASEPKDIVRICRKIMPFPPGCYWKDGVFTRFCDPAEVTEISRDDADAAAGRIRELLVKAVAKRMVSDAPVGYLLSGGLDSSLVCAISSRLQREPVRTFAIGMDTDAIDLKYARQAADFIGADHTEVIISRQDVLDNLEEVIRILGTFDITTIRASMGMYLCCRYIHEHTDVRVLLTGEVSDELFGYKYTDFAPSPEEFQNEAAKRVRELHEYDVLRADRCISVNSIEARVPFGDLEFEKYVMSLDPAIKMNVYGKGKYLLRHAFDKGEWLPEGILMREKAAFSDAVGHSMVDDLKEYANAYYTDAEFEEKRRQYTHAQPFTKESLLYREIFEKYYPGQSGMVTGFWMPNKTWPGCNVNDPSARVLSNYGTSGQ